MQRVLLWATVIIVSTLKLSAQCWRQIAGASYNQGFHSAGIQQDGSLWCWGLNTDGQLGDGTTINKLVPTQVGTDTDWAYVATGSDATYALKQNGTLWAWGKNSYGQLSDGTTVSRSLPAEVLPGTTWLRVSAGESFFVAQKSDGTLWSCGLNDFAQLGLGGGGGSSHTLLQNSTATNWVAISCGSRHTILMKSDHTVWGFGEGDLGKLVTGNDGGYDVPTQILSGTNWVQGIATGLNSIFLKQDGTLWGVGQNSSGNLGLGNNTLGIYALTQIGSDTDWLRIEPSTTHTMLLKSNRSLWTCGRNSSGQLGNGTFTNTNLFAQVGTATNWGKASCSRIHTLALDTNGTLWTWGGNASGQLGNGTTTSSNVPIQIGTVCDLGVQELENTRMQLLSNPVNEIVQLSFARDGVKHLSFYTLQGTLLKEQDAFGDFVALDVSGWATGVYIIRCQSELGMESLKFVKE